MRLTKQDQEILGNIYTEAFGFGGTGPQVNYKKQAKTYGDEKEAFLSAQTPGEPLKNKDGSEDEGTIYLGDGVYLGTNDDGQLVIATHGVVNIGADSTMDWGKYKQYSRKVPVTPEILKLAAANANKI